MPSNGPPLGGKPLPPPPPPRYVPGKGSFSFNSQVVVKSNQQYWCQHCQELVRNHDQISVARTALGASSATIWFYHTKCYESLSGPEHIPPIKFVESGDSEWRIK